MDSLLLHPEFIADQFSIATSGKTKATALLFSCPSLQESEESPIQLLLKSNSAAPNQTERRDDVVVISSDSPEDSRSESFYDSRIGFSMSIIDVIPNESSMGSSKGKQLKNDVERSSFEGQGVICKDAFDSKKINQDVVQRSVIDANSRVKRASDSSHCEEVPRESSVLTKAALYLNDVVLPLFELKPCGLSHFSFNEEEVQDVREADEQRHTLFKGVRESNAPEERKMRSAGETCDDMLMEFNSTAKQAIEQVLAVSCQ